MSRISPISGSSRITSLLYCRAGSATASSLCLVRPASQLSMGRNSYSSRGSSPSFSKRLMRCALRSIPCSSGHQSGKPCCLISAMARRLCSSRSADHNGTCAPGIYGGAIHNPLQVLCEIIARLHDANGQIAIPGLYNSVRRWSETERDYMARIGPPDEQILEDAGAARSWGECGYTLYERTTIRPALTVNGIVGGYQGPGSKGVIPARALAKLSFRLASDQEPQQVERLFSRAHCPSYASHRPLTGASCVGRQTSAGEPWAPRNAGRDACV